MIAIPGYSIERELGRGGMATVYLAVQESLGRRVALKVLDPTLAASDPGFSQRFIREGRIAAALRHRHILAIHDVGVHAGQAFLALEYLPGGSAAEQAGRMPAREALRLLREIAGALAHAHAAGIVHRDVKPENILRHDDGGFVLADFGIARAADLSLVTKEGSTVGTPAYMAPEQWRSQAIDGRADLYSLGVVLYQLLTGRVPYRGSDGWAIGMQHMQAPLPELPVEFAGLQALLAKLMAKDPAARFQSGAEVVAAVETLERRPDPAQPEHTPATQPVVEAMGRLRQRPERLAALLAPPPRRWPRYALGGAALAALLAIVAWLLPRDGSARLDRLFAGSEQLASIAVMPCESYTGSAEHRLLGDVLAEELIHRLSRLRALTVIARASTFPLRDQGLDPAGIGQRLDASHLLACTVRPTANGVRIGAELVDTKSGAQRWSAEFDRGEADLLGVVDELAVGISERLLVNLAGAERARLIRHRTESVEAIRLVEQGRARARQGTLAGVEQGRTAIEQALALDPDYALAHVALADVLRGQMQLQQRDLDWWRRQVEPLLERALALDDELPGAYLLRGQLHCAALDWMACRGDLERALALEPGAADVQAALADFHMHLGDRRRAVQHALRLVQIEPESALSWDLLAQALLRADRAGDALAAADRTLQRFPDYAPAHQSRAEALLRGGRCPAAVEAIERAEALSDAPLELRAAGAAMQVCAGRRERAVALLRELEQMRAIGDPVGDFTFAATQLALGDVPATLDALEAMQAAGDPRLWRWLPAAPHGSERLAGEPRLLALLDRLALPPEAMRWDPR